MLDGDLQEESLTQASARPRAAARTRLLVEGPILATLLRLAVPNLGEAAARVAFVACDAVFVGWLGTDALAGASLVFPIFLIMQMMSASGLGAGIASAVARAIGGGRRRDADALAGQAVLLALACALLCAAAMLLGGPSLYRALGAKGGVLQAALLYSALVFGGGAFVVWLMNSLANIVRGTGEMLVPASAIIAGEAVHLTLSPSLVLGWGPLPRLGIAGAAIAIIACSATGAVILLAYLRSGRSTVRLAARALRPQLEQARDILRVGAFAALSVLQWQSATIAVTAAAATFGAAALAGYGAATRLELLQLPLTFALGSAMITMVATNIGAGNVARARRIAWTGVALTTLLGLAFTAIALLLPAAWLGLFTRDPAVADAGALYLVILGPSYPALGFSVGLFFAMQGVGRVVLPVVAGALRLAIIVGGAAAVLGGSSVGEPLLYRLLVLANLLFALGMLAASAPALIRRTQPATMGPATR